MAEHEASPRNLWEKLLALAASMVSDASHLPTHHLFLILSS